MSKAYPQCERCFVDENSAWEPESVGDDGSIISKLLSVTVPLELVTGEINVCCDCGEITVIGIYVEREKNEITYDVEPLSIEELNTEYED
jgi:hypothetical protein